MPVIGWLIGSSFAGLVETLDHWIALGLLVFVGGSMIRNALTGEPESCDVVERNSGWLALFATGLVMANTAYGLWQAWWMSGYLASGLMMALAVRAAAVREPPPVA